MRNTNIKDEVAKYHHLIFTRKLITKALGRKNRSMERSERP